MLGSSLIDSNKIITNLPFSYGIYLVSSSDNTIKDSVINSVNDSDVIINNGENNIFLNSSYLDESVSGELIRKWYLNTYVNDSQGNPIYQANVTVWNILGTFAFSELTNSNGIIDTQELIEYINNGTTKVYYSNYTVNVTKQGYNYQTKSLNISSNKDIFFTFYVPNDTSKYYIKDSSGNPVAWFGNFGNIVLKGNCSVSINCVAQANSFIVKNSTDDTVAYIDDNGNLCILKGDCSDESASCNPTRDAFIIRNSTSSNMSYIDFDGDLCLTGRLYQNSNP